MSTPFAPLDIPVPDRTIAEVFDDVCAKYPDRVAIVTPEESVGYRALREQVRTLADDFAADARSHLVVTTGHGIPSAVAMIAAAEVGKAITVLDASAPDQHRSELIDRIERSPSPPGSYLASPTSGSSGVPKVVLHDQRNVVANATRYAAAAHLTPDDRVLLSAPMSFLAAATHLFSTLLHGATLCCFDLATLGVHGLDQFIAEHGVTVVHLAPTALLSRGSGAPLPGVRLVGCDGDRLTAAAARFCRSRFPSATIVSRYCNSECNWIATWSIDPGAAIPDSLGAARIVPWAECSLSDDGELTVSGGHLALGYLGEPALTSERFSDVHGRRTFRTQDRARLDGAGGLELLGRTDDLVKIGGVLVDLVAVEQALLTVPGVTGAMAASTDDDRPRLVAAVTGTGLRGWQVRRDVARTVRTSFVPSVVAVLDELPVTDRGKRDRSAVVASLAIDLRPPFSSARSDVEHRLATVFATVLGVTDVGRDDDVFALGADSLALVELAAALSDVVGRTVTTETLLDHPTVAGLATVVDARGTDRVGDVIREVITTRDERTPLLMISGGSMARVGAMTRLAHLLGGRRSFVVSPRGFDRIWRPGRPDRSVGAFAERIATELADRGIDRIITLGHSAGGTVALEVARRLRARSVDVPLVVLLDTRPVDAGLLRRRRFVAQTGWELSNRTDGESAAGRLARYTGRRLRTRWLASTAGWLPRRGESRHLAFEAATELSMRSHEDTPYGGRVLLVKATDSPWVRSLSAWSPWIDDLVTASVPGDHNGMLTGDRAPLTAMVIRRVLDGI
ncbi:MAG: AMP-binding protein [Ilumatobacteraceae bacterium]